MVDVGSIRISRKHGASLERLSIPFLNTMLQRIQEFEKGEGRRGGVYTPVDILIGDHISYRPTCTYKSTFNCKK